MKESSSSGEQTHSSVGSLVVEVDSLYESNENTIQRALLIEKLQRDNVKEQMWVESRSKCVLRRVLGAKKQLKRIRQSRQGILVSVTRRLDLLHWNFDVHFFALTYMQSGVVGSF